MRTQKEALAWMEQICDCVFGRLFPAPRYMAIFLCRPEGAKHYYLHIVPKEPFTLVDGLVFKDMTGFNTFNPSRVVFKLPFKEGQ